MEEAYEFNEFDGGCTRKKVQAGEVTVEEAVLDALEQIEKKKIRFTVMLLC